MKIFKLQTEGEGNGKKLSKKKAAEKMMEELKKLPPLSPVEEPPNRVNTKVRRKQLQQQQSSPVGFRNFTRISLDLLKFLSPAYQKEKPQSDQGETRVE